LSRPEVREHCERAAFQAKNKCVRGLHVFREFLNCAFARNIGPQVERRRVKMALSHVIETLYYK
jgi:hypothetical protein